MNRRWLLGSGMMGSFGIGLAGRAGAGMSPASVSPQAGEDELGAVGDGMRDASAVIQRRIDAGQGPVVLPRGRYRLTRPIQVPLDEVGPTAILGQGDATLVMDAPGPAVLVTGTHGGTAGPSSVRDEIWLDQRMPLLDAFAIEGAHPEADGVRLEGTMQAILTRLLIRRCRTGVHLTRRNRNLVISACQIYHNRAIGVHFDAVNLHQAIVADSHISYNPVAGIFLDRGELRNFQIVGNDIEYNYEDGREGSADILVDVAEDGASFREGTIVGNTIQARPSPGGANVRVRGGTDLRTSGLLAITGNLIGSQETNIHLDRCRGTTISGNSIYSAMANSLLIERSANVTVSGNPLDWNPDTRGKQYVDGVTIRDSRGVTITGLNLEECLRTEDAAIDISASEDVTLSACQVLDPSGIGLRLRDTVACRVADCTVRDRRAGDDRMMTASIVVEGEASRGNAVRGAIVDAGTLAVADGTAVVTDTLELGGDGTS